MAKFAEFSDVEARYEGDIPGDRAEWVELRLTDAESELIGLVPSLTADISTLDVDRVARVKRLICDKVLALYRNPDGALTISNTEGPWSESRTLPGSRVEPGSWVNFTDQELRRVGAVIETGSSGSVLLRAWGYP